VLVARNKIVCAGSQIREVASTASGNHNFLPNALGVLDHYNLAAAFSGLNRAEEPGCACADHQNICLMHAQSLSPVTKAQ
jgi:hypothetical protein